MTPKDVVYLGFGLDCTTIISFFIFMLLIVKYRKLQNINFNILLTISAAEGLSAGITLPSYISYMLNNNY